MAHFFEKRDRWGHGMAVWVLAAMVFLLPLAVWSLKQIHLENDIANWLPDEDPQAKTLAWYLNHFEHEDRVLVSWDGSTLNDPRIPRLAKLLAGVDDPSGRRRHGLKQVKEVNTPQSVLAKMVENKVPLEDAIARLQGVLIGTGPLKVRLTDAGREQTRTTLHDLTEKAKAELGIDIQILDKVTEWVPPKDFFDGVEPVASDELKFASLPEHDFQVRWDGILPQSPMTRRFIKLASTLKSYPEGDDSQGIRLIDSCFFAPGAPVALSITLSEAGIADKHGTMQAIRDAAKQAGIPADAFRMGGRMVANAELNSEVKKAAWNRDASIWQFHKRSVVLLSGIVGIALAFLMLRSMRLALLVLFVSYYAAFLAVALVPATGGSMNMVLVVMPTLLMVLTMSGAIHVANYWKHAAHKNLGTAVVQAIRMARTPCALASITTAIGLLSLTTSTLSPVRDFGLYSAIGCVITLLAVLYALPALLQYWPSRPSAADEVDRSVWELLGRKLAKYQIPVVVASLLVFASATYGLKYFKTETKAIRYFPETARVVQDYRFLEENLAGIVPVDLIVKFDEDAQRQLDFLKRMEIVRGIQNDMRQHPEISGTLSITDFRPVAKPRPESKSVIVQMRYNREVSTTEKRMKEPGSGAESFLTVAPKATDLYYPGDALLNRAGDELWRITAQVAIMSDLDYGDLTEEINTIAQSKLRYYAGAGHIVTGMVPVFLRTQQAVLESLIRSFVLAFVVIAIVIMFVLKNPVAGLITMIPNIMPIGIVFGLISWAGLAVDIGTMITASVALGIAVDGTLHLLTWFRKAIDDGMNRRDAVAHALGHCGPAMWQTSLVVGLGLLMLYPADLLLVSRFGWLMAALIGAALIGDVIVLPALLAGPLGRLLQRPGDGETASQSADTQDAAGTDSEHVAAVHSTTTSVGLPAKPHGLFGAPWSNPAIRPH